MKRVLAFLLFVQMGLALTIDHVPREGLGDVLEFEVPKDFSNGALKQSFLRRLKELFGCEMFVESGTYLGNTAFEASKVFEKVHTIEVSKKFHRKAARRFGKGKKVELHLGDSGDLLGKILPLCKGKALLYLDGHYDGEGSGKGVENTPIWRELEAIERSGIADGVILIDDVCDFQKSRYPERIAGTCFEGYPSLGEVVEKILEINPQYKICFLGNDLLAFKDDVAVSGVMRSCAIDRLAGEFPIFSSEMALRCEERIAKSRGNERAELIRYFEAYAGFEWEHDWRSYAGFWRGLTLLEEERFSEARQLFELSAMHGLAGWRAERYIGR